MTSAREWRWPAVAASFAVAAAAPSIGASPEADERFHIYTHTARFGANPWRLVKHAFETVPDFLDRGNFRPLGRIVEWSGQVFVGELSLLLNIPINISLGILRLISVAALASAVLWLASAVLERPGATDSRSGLLPACALMVGSSFLVSQTGGPVNLFAWLYLGTGALVVLAARLLANAELYTGSLSRRRGILFVFLGVALASTNEVTAIAIPLGLVVIVTRSLVLRVSLGRAITRMPAIRAWGLQLVGFLAVFVPVRLVIAARCTGVDCYSASDVALTSAYPETVVGRMATGFVPTQWAEGMSSDSLDALAGRSGIAVLIGFVVIVTPVIVSYVRKWGAIDAQAPDSVSVAALGLLGAGLAFAATSLISLSQVLQDPSLRVGLAWRDSALATPGIALSLAALLVSIAHNERLRASVAPRLGIATVGIFAVFMSFMTTWSVGEATKADPERVLNNRIAFEAVVFSEGAEANAYRCGLLAAWTESYRDKNWEWRPDQLRYALTDFVRYAHGASDFCAED